MENILDLEFGEEGEVQYGNIVISISVTKISKKEIQVSVNIEEKAEAQIPMWQRTSPTGGHRC